MAKKLTSSKAKEILRDGKVHGKSLTAKQKRYFGYIAGGGKAQAGAELPEDYKYRWNNLLKFAKVDLGYKPGDPALNKRSTTSLMVSKYNEANPNARFEEEWIPYVQEEFDKANVDFKGFSERKKLGKGVGYNEKVSPYDSIIGPLTINQPYPGLEEKRFHNNRLVSQVNKGLVGPQFTPTGGKQTSAFRTASMVTPPKGAKSFQNAEGQWLYETPEGEIKYMEKLKYGGKMKKKKKKLSYEDGGITQLTDDTIQFNGPSHAKGGMDIAYGGQKVEVEGAETGYFGDDGALNIMGNMINPLTNKKFKQDSKNLAKKEKKIDKLIQYSRDEIDNVDMSSKWGQVKANSIMMMLTGSHQKKKEIGDSKEWLATLQKVMLDTAEEQGVDPQEFSKGNFGKKIKYENGGKIKAQAGTVATGTYEKMISEAAAKHGVDPQLILRLVEMESGKRTSAESDKGALGIMQMIPSTAKKYGITRAQLRSSNPSDVQKVIDAGVQHFSELLQANNNDPKLALAAYNGGQGSVDFVKKKLGKHTISGDEWVEYMENRREKSPSSNRHAWQNETLDYVTGISGTSEGDFQTRSKTFRNKYYSPDIEKIREQVKKKYKTDLPEDLDTVEKIRKYVEQYNPDRVEQRDYTLDIEEPKKYGRPTNAKGLSFEQIIPELYTFATNREEPVHLQQFNPQLYQDYEVSFQDRLNENQATFAAAARAAEGSPSALAILAAQKYGADSSVLGEEFRTNQAIEADITNKNIALLNDAQLKNLGLADIQYGRQSQAKSTTKATNRAVVSSIADKLKQNEYEQITQKIYENLYPHFTFDTTTGEAIQVGPKGQEYINWGGTSNMGNSDKRVTEVRDEFGRVKQTRETTMPAIDQALKYQRFQKQNQPSIIQQIKKKYLLPQIGYPYWGQ